MAHAQMLAHCTITSGTSYPRENAIKNMPTRKKKIIDLLNKYDWNISNS